MEHGAPSLSTALAPLTSHPLASSTSTKSDSSSNKVDHPSTWSTPGGHQHATATEMVTPPPSAHPDRADRLCIHDNVALQAALQDKLPVLLQELFDDASKRIQLSFLPQSKNAIGTGRFAQVYRAQYTHAAAPGLLQHTCAVKRPFDEQEAQEALLVDAIIQRQITPHPNIVDYIAVVPELDRLQPATFQYGGEDSTLLLVQSYYANGNLWDWALKRREQIGRRMWLRWAKQLCAAVQHVHTHHIIHHDIKPQNVLVSDDLDLKLSDFGNALFTNPDGSPLHDALGRGTDGYIAPEILAPPFEYTISSDMYSLGVTFYALLSLENPWRALRSPVQMLVYCQRGFFASDVHGLPSTFHFPNGDGIPTAMDDLIMGMTAVKPGDRWSMDKVMAQLDLLDAVMVDDPEKPLGPGCIGSPSAKGDARLPTDLMPLPIDVAHVPIHFGSDQALHQQEMASPSVTDEGAAHIASKSSQEKPMENLHVHTAADPMDASRPVASVLVAKSNGDLSPTVLSNLHSTKELNPKKRFLYL